jgi:K+-sensing histidine kinase KdpD
VERFFGDMRGADYARAVRRACPAANFYAVFTAALRYSEFMSEPRAWTGYAWATGAAAACTLAGLAMAPRFDPVNIAMVYLLAVVLVALRYSRGAAVAASVMGIVAFNFFFVPPVRSFAVHDPQHLLTFAIMLAVALVISHLVASVRGQAKAQAELAIAAETERVRSALLASISHDLRTPLAVMSGASSSLAERGEQLGAEERRALAGTVYRQARDMAEVMGNVLQMTRLENGAIVLARDWDSLAEIAGSALERVGGRLAGHRVMVDLPPDLPLVRVDAILIEQVLGNLLENAARHTPAGTLVRLRAAVLQGELTVSVEDFGPGLQPEDFKRLFAKFHHGAVEGPAGGVGLGLAICRAVLKLHGGRIWAEQLPGGGSAFRFTLPLEPPPQPPEEERPPTPVAVDP